IDQRLSPQYISVHVTEPEVRARLMGLRKDDRILEKIALLHDNGIDMHTQIVLCPGVNDGAILEKTVRDLYRFHRRIVSLAVVPVGLTDHRFGLAALGKIDRAYASRLLDTVGAWQREFRRKIRRAFVYPSDEFYLLAGRAIPPAAAYDGFPQIENGVGLVRSFLAEFRAQSGSFPARLRARRRLTLATGELAAPFITTRIAGRLARIGNLEVRVRVVPNVLFGRSVTVAGLLSGKCLYSALEGGDSGDLLLLPPDIVNADGVLLDDATIPQIEERLGVSVMMYDGDWNAVMRALKGSQRRHHTRHLLPSSTT
ncbi:MAG TPA: DUF512 domain-containing protein, partial [Bacteroidota bacterium]|nr:DUF512 domain-containing protein [Bacteroidota bacterium]